MNNNSPKSAEQVQQNNGKQAGQLLDRYTVQPQSNDGNDSPFYKASAPTISLPKGGGALKGIDEKFSVNAVNGTAGLELPLPLTPGRGGFTPALSISYNSGGGNSVFGLGWNLSLPSIQRKTDKKLPRYNDAEESDIFLLAGAEDLVPKFLDNTTSPDEPTVTGYFVKRYVPRIEGLFARIEYIRKDDETQAWWRVTTKDNITTYYGLTAEARISDPANPDRIFQWLPQLSTDHKGNVQLYEYVQENNLGVAELHQVHEQNRLNGNQPFTNTYLKCLQYCNETAWYIDTEGAYEPSVTGLPAFLMKGVLDYGDHDDSIYDDHIPTATPNASWPVRKDPFSSFHAGFEIRTYRRCKRVMMFHYFNELRLNPADSNSAIKSLVRTLELEYKNDHPSTASLTEADMIISATQWGYIFDKYTAAWQKKNLPAMQFYYQPLQWNKEIKEVSREDFTHAPQGLSGPYQWTDLEGEGISGILTEQAGGWFYKNNLGDGHFTPARSVSSKPSFAGLGNNLQWQDLDADGSRQVVAQEPVSGYWELEHPIHDMPEKEGQWRPFRTFPQNLNIDTSSPFTKMLDLDGDGRADILLAEDQVWTWYHNEGREGFGTGGKAAIFTDEEKGPVLLLRDTVQSIFLADMNGDGMTDLVRIKNGEVCYWPNMGYGRFGAKVSMSNAPLFTTTDQFNPQYISLADISGTGAADLIYLNKERCTAWINLAGNGWANAEELAVLPSTDPFSKIAVLDFLGNGTGCLVWSSPLPRHAHMPMRYADLMGGKKPYLLFAYNNGMGKHTEVTYKSSTQFYLEDKRNGYPWATRLPFPVHCIHTITTRDDEVSETVYTQSYRYRHGYYDHAEREFRGFGYVETLDTDSATVSDLDTLDQAPVLTKTWYHTGAWMRHNLLTEAYKSEYFPIPGWEDEVTILTIEPGMKAQELREAYRAFKGSPLRQEVYALDGDIEKQHIPYSVTATAYKLNKLQGIKTTSVSDESAPLYGVFLMLQEQSIVFSTERNPVDARVMQELVLETDRYGNACKTAQVAYPRRFPEAVDDDRPVKVKRMQSKMHITVTETKYTNDVTEHDLHYRLRVPWRTTSFEALGLDEPEDTLWTIANLHLQLYGNPEATPAIPAVDEYDFAAALPSGPAKRRLSDKIAIFKPNTATGQLSNGILESLAIPHESYTMAFSDDITEVCYGLEETEAIALINAEGYRTLSGQEGYWIPSGTATYPSPANRFFTPEEYIDPWDKHTLVSFGTSNNYWLLPHNVTDDLGNTSTVNAYDWRILQPLVMTDANDNISEILYDQLGMPVAMAVKGKGTEGDSLTTLVGGNPVPVPNLYTVNDLDAQEAFFENPMANAADLLGNATWRCVYNLESLPVAVGMIARAIHVADLEEEEESELIVRISYSDAFGRIAMHKAPCDKPLSNGSTTPAWVGSGRTVYNNKGKAVMQFEPYFSDTPEYDPANQAAADGVSPKVFYDPLGRAYRTDMPDGSFSKTTWTAWEQTVWDQNDTVMDSQWYDDRDGLAGSDEEYKAAMKAAEHANTPTVMHTDSLARPFYTVQYLTDMNDISPEKYESFVNLDIQGNRLSVIDAARIKLGLLEDPDDSVKTLTYRYNMLQQPCYQESIDSGINLILTDIAGQPLAAWDAEGHKFTLFYDELRRLTEKKLNDTIILEKTEYSDTINTGSTENRRGQVLAHYDGSGKQWIPDGYDFKGNPVVSAMSLLADPTTTDADWSSALSLETEVFTSESLQDALGRPVWMKDPGGNETMYEYDLSGALKKVLFRKYDATPPDPYPFTEYVKDIHYDAQGLRQRIWYGNDTKTNYTYDPLTYRLRRLNTINLKTGSSTYNEMIQDMYYYYDPVGNITHITYGTEPILFYSNSMILPEQDFTYDALYRLIAASGREMASANSFDDDDHWTVAVQTQPASNAARNYTQYYEYDAVGNIESLQHAAGTGSYTRTYDYGNNNRLTDSHAGGEDYTYAYDARGNFTQMPRLSTMSWSAANELCGISVGSPLQAYYQYSGGQRVRKYVDKVATQEERIYLGNFEIYRKFDSSSLTLKRTTVHISDDTGRIAMLEFKDPDYDDDDSVAELTRYIYSNHLQSATLEMDEHAEVISYEEYHPYGTTAYTYQDEDVQAVAKRYRYTGKERDDESGLYYHGARYYVAWLCRWCAVDPLESKYAGMSPYNYCENNPVMMTDPSGMGPEDGTDKVPPLVAAPKEQATVNWYRSVTRTDGMLEMSNGSIQLPAVTVKEKYQYKDRGPGEYHFKMTMGEDGTANMELISFRNKNHHSFLGLFNWDTKILSKRYTVDFDLPGEGNKTYYIGGAAYGKSYSNSGLAEDFENNYLKKRGDPINFFFNYADKNGSYAASTAYYAINAQNQMMEAAIPMAPLSKLERDILAQSRNVLNSNEFDIIRQAHQNRVPAEVNINGRTIIYEPDFTYGEAMTLHGENGFLLGPGAFTSKGGVTHTVLWETTRLNTQGTGSLGVNQTTRYTETAQQTADKLLPYLQKKK